MGPGTEDACHWNATPIWRHRKRQIISIDCIEERAQLHSTIDGSCLRLRIDRQACKISSTAGKGITVWVALAFHKTSAKTSKSNITQCLWKIVSIFGLAHLGERAPTWSQDRRHLRRRSCKSKHNLILYRRENRIHAWKWKLEDLTTSVTWF